VSEAPCRVAVRLVRAGFSLEVDVAWDEHAVVIFGPSGAGKSTLFEVLLGLHSQATARVRLGGEWLEDSERGLRLPVHERRLGWVPQDPTLFPHLSVGGNLRFGLRRREASARERVARAVEVLELGGLLDRPVEALSGGQRQRVAIARALACGPRALLLDEPLSSLDLALRARVLPHLLRVREELDVPILTITHEPDEAMLLGQRVVVIDAGRIVATGPPREVMWSRAVLPLSAALGLENVYHGRVVERGEREATLETPGGLRLVLPFPLEAGDSACVGLRAEDVLLAADPPGRVSARNVCEARVTECEPAGGDAFVHLAVGPGAERLVAKLTAAAAEKLALGPGVRVYALVKSQALRRIA
jgi:molybdate transport system ATP-binding protein